MLLSKLPLEIREQIFGLVLGIDSNTTFHFISRVNGVGHVKCPREPQHPHLSDCHCSATIHNATYLSPEAVRRQTKLSNIDLALLQTCRRAYREGIHFLYARPTFDFPHPETLTWLARTVPPQRLSAVTKLHISLQRAPPDSWRVPANEKVPFRKTRPSRRRARNDCDLLRYWDPAWRTILCGMTGLKHLTVSLFGSMFDDPVHAEMALKPMMELRGLMTFRLRLRGGDSSEEDARLESLKEKSAMLRVVLEGAASKASGRKRKAEELDWKGPDPTKKRRQRRRDVYRY
jgi:hypothetical protein